ncbi:MAG: hypothetical protein JNJ93_04410, partial [Acinetobacter sp.]|nr:hypothetical protein [Acinetobacter sp.]
AVILVIGFWLANIVANVVQRGEYNSSRWLGSLVRVLIMGLVVAMGLRAMGIADSIVNLAFGLTLGAVAVAFALAFGLGGRQPAERVLTDLIDKAKKEGCQPNPLKDQARACGFGMPAASAQAPADDGYPVRQTEAPGVAEKETATPDQLDVDPAQAPINNPYGSTGENEKNPDARSGKDDPK